MSSGFVAGTLVHTDKGLVPIQNLKVGDLVWSKNLVTNEKSLQPILESQKIQNQDIWQVEHFEDVETESEPYYIYGSENSLIWVLGDADGYEGTPVKWTRITDDDMQTMSLIEFINGQKACLSWTYPVFITDINDMGCAVDSLENEPQILIDFSDDKLTYYYIGDVIEPYGKSFGVTEQGLIYIEPTDICKNPTEYYELDNMVFDKYPKVAKFVLGFFLGNNRSSKYFKRDVYQITVAENHNYFVGNLGILVGDSTIQGNDK